MTIPRVFISYSHDDEAHAARVRALADALRRDGVDVELDQYHQHAPPTDGWNLWAAGLVDSANRVLLVCTPTYQRRYTKQEAPGKGLGATYEAAVIRARLAAAGVKHSRFFAVVFDAGHVATIPPELADTHYVVLDQGPGERGSATNTPYEDLLRLLHGRPRVERPPVGEPPELPASPPVATFPRPGGRSAAAATVTSPAPRTESPAVTGRHVTVLHLSDLQFGRHQREWGRLDEGGTGPTEFDTAFRRLADDLTGLWSAGVPRPDLVLVTGDLAEQGKRVEFDAAKGFLEALAGELGMPRRRMLVIPGNHDINWPACRSYFDDCEARDEKPRPPYWKKWENFVERLLKPFYGDELTALAPSFAPDQPWLLLRDDSLRVIVAGMNSTLVESHRDADHYGWIGEPQARWFAEQLNRPENRSWLRLVAVHHNPRRGEVADDENLRDASELDRWLAPHAHALFHGHTHRAKGDLLARGVPIFATGSAALRSEARPPEVPNQYQIVQFHADGWTRWTRRYAPADRRWEADCSLSRDGNQWRTSEPCAWLDGEAVFPRAASDGTVRHDATERLEHLERKQAWSAGLRDGEEGGGSFAAQVRAIWTCKHPTARLEWTSPGSGRIGYFRVTEGQGDGVAVYLLGVQPGELAADGLEVFLEGPQLAMRQRDPQQWSWLIVERGPLDAGMVSRARQHRLKIETLVQAQGLEDLGPFVQAQRQRLQNDPLYPPALYVDQRMDGGLPGAEITSENAIESICGWLHDPEARLVLVLGSFGTGKTFLMHQLAVRLATTEGAPHPVLLNLRDLDKSFDVGQMLNHAFGALEQSFDPRRIRFMRDRGRLALLFDGYDELAVRVTYDRAAEHVEQIREAFVEQAKIVLTCRTEHLERDEQLWAKFKDRHGAYLARLLPFTEPQVRQFLVNRLCLERPELLTADRERLADEKLSQIRGIPDLPHLASTPRLLGFIADLTPAQLEQARGEDGKIESAHVYRLLFERWIDFEVKRRRHKAQRGLHRDEAAEREACWRAVTALALRLWEQVEPTVDVSELEPIVAGQLKDFDGIDSTKGVATQAVGSGTLLVRDGGGRFSFLHASVMEWLVARRVAEDIAGQGPTVCARRRLSPLMLDFLGTLVGRVTLAEWAERVCAGPLTEVLQQNCEGILAKVGRTDRPRVVMNGLDLRGTGGWAGRSLKGSSLIASDLSGEDLSGLCLDGADLTGAKLVGARLRRTSLRRATLRGTDFTRTDLLGADLTDVVIDQGTSFRMARAGGDRNGGLVPDAVRIAAWAQGGAVLGPALQDGSGVSPDPGLSGHLGGCTSCVWHPRFPVLATGHDSGAIVLWDGEIGCALRVLTGHAGSVFALAFNPDGSTLASGGDDAMVRLWNPMRGTEKVPPLMGHTRRVSAVAFNPDGSTLASGAEDDMVRLWDPVRWKEKARPLRGYAGSVTALAFNRDGSILASGEEDGTVHLRDLVRGKAKTPPLTAHTGPVLALAFNPDGSTLVSSAEDGTVRLWDLVHGKEKEPPHKVHSKRVRAVAFNPDGSTLVSGADDSTVRLWDPVRGKEKTRPLTGHAGSVLAVAFNPDGSTLASGADDGTVHLWDPASGRERARSLTGRAGRVYAVAFNPDGSTLASSGDDGVVHLWDPVRGKEKTPPPTGHAGRVWAVAFNPDGSTLASGADDSTVRLWDPVRGKEKAPPLTGHAGSVWAVAFNPEGSTLASGAADRTVRLWDPVRGKEKTPPLTGHAGSVRAVAFNPDGSTLASGADDSTVRLWDPVRGKEKAPPLTGHAGSVWAVAFNPEGSTLASGMDDRTVRLWDPVRGKEKTRPLTGHAGSVWAVAFNPDGSTLASGADDRTVRLWDPVRGKEKTPPLTGHAGSVRAVAFSADGSLLASASGDGTIRLWDPATGACRAILLGLPSGWVAYRPDGRYRLGGDVRGSFWHVLNYCRFEPGELDEVLDQPLRLGDDELLIDRRRGDRSDRRARKGDRTA